MTTDTTRARALLAAGPINPRTGRVWSLADPEMAPLARDVERRILCSRESARAVLRQIARKA